MIVLDKNASETLTFNVTMTGAKEADISAFLRFELNGIEYGIRGMHNQSKVTVIIPPLHNIVNNSEDIHSVDARLDIVGKGFYHVPWKETLKFKEEVSVSASLSGKTSEVDKPETVAVVSVGSVQQESVEAVEENSEDIIETIVEASSKVVEEEEVIPVEEVEEAPKDTYSKLLDLLKKR